MVNGWHWSGRIISILFLIYTIIYIIMNAIPNLSTLSPFDMLAGTGIALTLWGLVLGWFKDLMGGWLIVGGWIVYFTMYIMHDISFWQDYIMLPSIIPGICYLMGYWKNTQNEEIG